MKQILFKVHEEYEDKFTAYIRNNQYFILEIAKTGDYLEFGYCLYLMFCEEKRVDSLVMGLKEEAVQYENDSYSNIMMYVLA